MSRGVRRLLAAAAVLAVTMTAGCSATGTDDDSGPSPSPSRSQTGAAREYLTQHVDWSTCFDKFQCATVKVPLDWDDPDGSEIGIAVIRTQQADNTRGTILVDPGGPGGSGFNIVKDSLGYVTTDRLQSHYAIAGFDPRGVGRSSAVDCFTDAGRDRMRSNDADPDTDAGFKNLRSMYHRFANACQKHTGALLEHVDTESAARDMDVIRAALGERKLNYLGFSYGTKLGATYARLYPGKVGRFVLDGALDPSLTSVQIALGQAKGFERELRVYIRRCGQQPDCPLDGGVDHGARQVRALLDSATRTPLTATDGRKVGGSLLASGIIAALYNTANWQYLTQGLAGAMNGDPSVLLALADQSADRDQSGNYTSNGNEAFIAINCLDYSPPAKKAAMRAVAARIEKASPTFGPELAYTGLTCANWPVPSTAHAPKPPGTDKPGTDKPGTDKPGTAPILVVGTTGDPATPYAWAKSLTRKLPGARLLTWKGEGHTAYGRAGPCINKKVDAYFVTGTMPPRGTTCR
ncbi:alpha/beta hydrolase [Spelaeicoccus albus]|uniref:Pimeloyl-ACP methyl ester carboxylesterase n=1 Tax=Spelaeicoccus albus TaxID=1280376 RepID=A0A7Z0D193_9MICO|nr:alpha/beta hydrolase [Spelaeicoccus albus]NYI65710.1 pimeloyl-ACP methyl ester carboxylesterase [Spelaeicoccus albus]